MTHHDDIHLCAGSGQAGNLAIAILQGRKASVKHSSLNGINLEAENKPVEEISKFYFMVASQLTIRSFYLSPFLAFRFLPVHFSLFKAEPKKKTLLRN